MTAYTNRCLPVAILLLQVMLLSTPVSAQVLEEVIVTAQKREQGMQEIGLSITALNGEQMRDFGMTRSVDLAAQTPGLNLDGTVGGTYQSIPTIRGVTQNDFSAIQEAPNAVYLDGVYLSSINIAQFGLFDVDRAEVLRGPQGTLFGRNATGGVVHFISRKPTEEFEAYVDAQLFDQNGFGGRAEAAVSGSISDTARGRLAGYYAAQDGYWDNDLAGANDVYETDGDYALRAQLEFDINQDLTVGVNVLRGDFSRSDNGTYRYRPGAVDPATGFGFDLTAQNDPGAQNLVCAGCDFFGQDGSDSSPNDSSFNDVGHLEKELWSVTGNIEWQFDRFTLTSITNYMDVFTDYSEDCDGSGIDYCQFPILLDMQQFSQEIRLDGQIDRLTWQAGFYYLNIDADTNSGFQSTVFDFATGDKIDQDTRSWAVFTQLEYQISDQWNLIGGLRWTEDDKDFDSLVAFTNGASADPAVITQAANIIDNFSDSQSEGDWAGKVSLEYTPNDNWLIYAGVTRGNKAGGYVANLNGFALPESDREFGAEVLTNYELGFKGTNLFDDRVRLNASAFYYDYNGYQSFDFFGLGSVIRNRDAEIYGAEIEVAAAPAEGWDFLFGIALLDTEVSGVTLPTAQVVTNEAPKSPDLTLNGLLRKEWPAFGGTMAAQMDFNYSSKSYASVANSEATHLPSYIVGNAKLTYLSPDERWDMSLFVKNIADEDVQTFAFDLAIAAFGINIESYAPPRMVGMQGRYNW